MLQKDLTEVWVSEYIKINEHGEKVKKWIYKGTRLKVKDVHKMTVAELHRTKVKYLSNKKSNDEVAYLNLQQDINELDRKPSGEVDYSIENARTDIEYEIKKGNGISLTDISQEKDFIPDYIVTDNPKIGNTRLYKLEKYNGE